MAGNFKVRMYDLQNRYKFKVFCSGTPYDDSEVKQDISDLKNSKANKSETYSKSEANTLLNASGINLNMLKQLISYFQVGRVRFSDQNVKHLMYDVFRSLGVK